MKEDISVQERFLLFEDVYDVTGKTIFNSIKRLLSKNSLEITYMVGQVMDGAAAMSGSQSGAQKFISDDVTTAIYEHSVSHSLNLCQEKASQVPEILLCITAMCELNVFFKESPKRTKFLADIVEELNLIEEENDNHEHKKMEA